MQDVTDPTNRVSIAGNLTLQLNMTDYGEPGSNNTIGIQVTAGSTLWFSSSWGGSPARTQEQTLGGGNLFGSLETKRRHQRGVA